MYILATVYIRRIHQCPLMNWLANKSFKFTEHFALISTICMLYFDSSHGKPKKFGKPLSFLASSGKWGERESNVWKE